ncbi:hypothetical protein ACFLRW_06130 [Acidobacteriota bacterium]
MKNRKIVIIAFLFLIVTLNTGLAQDFNKSGPASIIAAVDSNCNPRPTQFSIDQNFLAIQFNMVSFNGGIDCTSERLVDEKGFTIQNQAGTEIFKWSQFLDNPPLQPLGLLNVLSLSPGTYTIKASGGRDALVILKFNIIEVNQNTPASPVIDSDRDGVPDIWDRCPNTPPNSLVDNGGCPGQTQIIDTDRDGVIDQWDMEPNTPPNSLVNKNGQRQAAVAVQQPMPNQTMPTQSMPTQPQQPVANMGGSAPWEIWLGRWEVVSTYSGCPAATTLPWWFEVIRQGKGYAILVQSGQKTKIDVLSDQNLDFKISDDAKTQIALWLTSDGQCEGTVLHPRNVKECQQARIEGQKRSE